MCNCSSVSDLDFPAEKRRFAHITASGHTQNDQNGSFQPSRAVFKQNMGVCEVTCFSLQDPPNKTQNLNHTCLFNSFVRPRCGGLHIGHRGNANRKLGIG